MHIVRKQFPLRPAAAKTIHRSQCDTETKIVVNFETRRAIPHIHHVGISRVTTTDGLYVTELCENKIAVSDDVRTEMHRLRTEGQLTFAVNPLYNVPEISLKICYLKARSLHKHIKDVRADLNYSSTDVSIFAESRFCNLDDDSFYNLTHDNKYNMFRNDAPARNPSNIRPYGGIVVYSCLDYYPGYPYCANTNGIEITVLRFIVIPHISIIGICRSPARSIVQLCAALQSILDSLQTEVNLFIGDFNIDWFNVANRLPLYNFFINNHGYRQLVNCTTTDNNTCIDHIYTNLPESQITFQISETYFSDHKGISAILNCF